MANSNELSSEDINILTNPHSSDDTIKVLDKVIDLYNSQNNTDKEKETAEQIFALLVKHTEVKVRKALSTNLMHNKDIPHDIVFSLAHDIDAISLPVLEFSQVLTDEDLIEIIESSKNTAAQLAIAKRINISEHVSHSLVKTKKSNVVSTLLQNETANINDTTYDLAIDEFADNHEIVEHIMMSGALSPKIIESLIQKVSAAIKEKIEAKYSRSFSDINKFFNDSKDSASFQLSTAHNISPQIINCVYNSKSKNTLDKDIANQNSTLAHLLNSKYIEGHLTPFAALVIGDLLLFEVSIAVKLKLPMDTVQRLVEGSQIELHKIYQKAGLSDSLFPATEFIISTIIDMNYNDQPAKDNLGEFVKILEKSKDIKNLQHFTSVIRKHVHSL